MKEIALSNGRKVMVDDEDYEELSKYSWHDIDGKAGRHVTIYMHRQIMGFTEGDGNLVDHRNGNSYDNRRLNLRSVDNSTNGLNRNHLNKNNTSGVTGISFDKETGKWMAQVCINRKNYKIGRFTSIDEAIAERRRFMIDVEYNNSNPIIQRMRKGLNPRAKYEKSNEERERYE